MQISNDRPVSRRGPEENKLNRQATRPIGSEHLFLDSKCKLQVAAVAETRKRPSWQLARSG